VSDFYERYSFSRIWPWVLLAVLAFLTAVQIYRVNAPPPGQIADPSATPVFWTRGSIFTGVQVVPGGRYLAARLDLNKRSTLTGWFKVNEPKQRINCLILPAAELDKWQRGVENQRVSETGFVASGRINRELEPGSNDLIHDNQSTPADREVTANFDVE
jgi:hypothetical protein